MNDGRLTPRSTTVRDPAECGRWLTFPAIYHRLTRLFKSGFSSCFVISHEQTYLLIFLIPRNDEKRHNDGEKKLFKNILRLNDMKNLEGSLILIARYLACHPRIGKYQMLGVRASGASLLIRNNIAPSDENYQNDRCRGLGNNAQS